MHHHSKLTTKMAKSYKFCWFWGTLSYLILFLPSNMTFCVNQNKPLQLLHLPMLSHHKMWETVSSRPSYKDKGLFQFQPSLATKDVLIIVFMFLLWGYSLYLTYRAWYKLLYSGGEESGNNMWRWSHSINFMIQM